MIFGFRGYIAQKLREEQQYMTNWLKAADESLEVSVSEKMREDLEKFIALGLDEETSSPRWVVEYLKDIGVAKEKFEKNLHYIPSRSIDFNYFHVSHLLAEIADIEADDLLYEITKPVRRYVWIANGRVRRYIKGKGTNSYDPYCDNAYRSLNLPYRFEVMEPAVKLALQNKLEEDILSLKGFGRKMKLFLLSQCPEVQNDLPESVKKMIKELYEEMYENKDRK